MSGVDNARTAIAPAKRRVPRRSAVGGHVLCVGYSLMKERKEAGITAAPAKATRAQTSRCAPVWSPVIPITQTATNRVNVANHRLMALDGRASQTKPARARSSATRATSGATGTEAFASIWSAEDHR